jgi:anti-sigma B factor antagonist
MEFQLEHRDGRLRASGDMNIYAANDMKQRMLACMATACAVESKAAESKEVLLDLSDVAEIDTCGLQILLLAERLAADQGRTLKIVEPSAATREVLTLCGLDRLRADVSRRAA